MELNPLLRIENSLEIAIAEIVDELDPSSPDAGLLCEYAGASFDELADQVLEILGLPQDDAWRVATDIAARMGTPRMVAAVERINRLLKAKNVHLGSKHLRVLSLSPPKTHRAH